MSLCRVNRPRGARGGVGNQATANAAVNMGVDMSILDQDAARQFMENQVCAIHFALMLIG
eukprot:COSAG01_NODE_14064_length_1500_cov_1.238401_1_plen_60_part_00